MLHCCGSLAKTTFIAACLVSGWVGMSVEQTCADEKPALKATTVPRPNLQLKTLGGKQLWSDVFWLNDWRIQYNAVSQHYRLLDAKNKRRAWGTYDECFNEFAAVRKQTEFKAPKTTVVVLLHGLGRSNNAMHKLATYLKSPPIDGKVEWDVASLTYASGRLSIDDHASNLARILESLSTEGVKEIHVVAHSLGNLVIRRYIGIQNSTEQSRVPELKRIVMLAPPNQGSRMAIVLKKNLLFRAIAGKSGQQIAELEELEAKFPTPQCEFAIIAGGRGKTGRNPILAGDDDLIVSVEETKLAGARDFMIVPSLHTFIMNEPTTQAATLSFLQHGYLKSAKDRTPLE